MYLEIYYINRVTLDSPRSQGAMFAIAGDSDRGSAQDSPCPPPSLSLSPSCLMIIWCANYGLKRGWMYGLVKTHYAQARPAVSVSVVNLAL